MLVTAEDGKKKKKSEAIIRCDGAQLNTIGFGV